MKILKLPREATVEDLHELDEKGELVNGEIVLMTPAGFLRHRAALNVAFHLRALEATHAGLRSGTAQRSWWNLHTGNRSAPMRRGTLESRPAGGSCRVPPYSRSR